MHALRFHPDAAPDRRAVDALGADASKLGRRILAAAQTAAAVHMAEVTRVELRTGETPMPPAQERTGETPMPLSFVGLAPEARS